MNKPLIVILVISIVSLLTLAAYTGIDRLRTPDGSSVKITEKIRLYSNGKLVGEWTGIGRGEMDGNTYVFRTEQGAFSPQIRIKGDFVVETLPN